MLLQLENVCPSGIPDVRLDESRIWNTEGIRLEPGTRYQLLGPSGAGKSTFLNLLFGTRSDYTGRVLIDGAELKSMPVDTLLQLRREKVAYVMQGLGLFPELTARQNIALKANLAATGFEVPVEAMANQLGVADLLDKPAGKLSFGQRQRMAIIRALVQPFSWLFLDEPFSHLDNETTGQAAGLINQALEANRAGLVYATHHSDTLFPHLTDLVL